VNVLESVGVRLLNFVLVKNFTFIFNMYIICVYFLFLLIKLLLCYNFRFLRGRPRTNIPGEGLQQSLRP
jgi:hypothetical protein